jgi:predicted flap endonuclease-1-like 5' DNA nuclease
MMTFRRYRQMKARSAADLSQEALAGLHATAADAAPAGTPLADDFPARALLTTAQVPYAYVEDLYGVTEGELTRIAGIGPATARRIIAAAKAALGED